MRWLAPALLSLLLCACAGQRGTPPQGDLRLWELETSARASFREGRYDAAMARYALAASRAAAIDDSDALVRVLYEHAAAAMRLGEDEEAASLAQEASRIDDRRGGGRAAQLSMLRAEIALRSGDPSGALALTDRPDTSDYAGELARLRGEALAMLGREAEGGAMLDRAASTGASRIGLDRLRGRLALASGDASAAAQWFDHEAETAAAAADPLSMARALARSAEALELAGEPGTAAERLLRCGRALAGQGRVIEAFIALQRAEELAVNADDDDLAASVRFWTTRLGIGTQ